MQPYELLDVIISGLRAEPLVLLYFLQQVGLGDVDLPLIVD
jgi:hypothetical protein